MWVVNLLIKKQRIALNYANLHLHFLKLLLNSFNIKSRNRTAYKQSIKILQFQKFSAILIFRFCLTFCTSIISFLPKNHLLINFTRVYCSIVSDFLHFSIRPTHRVIPLMDMCHTPLTLVVVSKWKSRGNCVPSTFDPFA